MHFYSQGLLPCKDYLFNRVHSEDATFTHLETKEGFVKIQQKPTAEEKQMLLAVLSPRFLLLYFKLRVNKIEK